MFLIWFCQETWFLAVNKFYVSVENNLNFITNEKYKIQIETDIKSNNVKILQIEFQTLL